MEGILDPTTPEAYACSKGLALAADLLAKKVAVSTVVIARLLLGKFMKEVLGPYATLLKEINTRRQEFSKSIVSFEGRDLNVEAHNLARSFVNCNVANMSSCLDWSDPDPTSVPMKIVA
jgi:hypothetical protein